MNFPKIIGRGQALETQLAAQIFTHTRSAITHYDNFQLKSGSESETHSEVHLSRQRNLLRRHRDTNLEDNHCPVHSRIRNCHIALDDLRSQLRQNNLRSRESRHIDTLSHNMSLHRHTAARHWHR